MHVQRTAGHHRDRNLHVAHSRPGFWLTFPVASAFSAAFLIFLVLRGTVYAFVTNEQVQVSFDCGANLRLRSGAGLSSSILASMPEGTALTVLNGSPVCSDGYLWWNVRRRSDNLSGWSAVAEWLTPHPVLGQPVTVANLCGQRLNLRDNPGVSGTNVITTMGQGTQMTVVAGPTCADGGAEATLVEWWRIAGTVDGVFQLGWSATGYWLETLCGNGSLNAGETCDGSNLNGASCVSQGFPSGGPLACNSTCTAYNTSGCFVCGNNIRQGNEQCDGSDLSGCSAGQTCNSSCMCQGSGDADGDGVPNATDLCPSTPSGQVVDSNGCSCSQKTCSDGLVCTTDSCNPSTAQCVFTYNTVSCDDGQFCTINDACNGAGTCVGGATRDCSAQTDQCNIGVCNEAIDQCIQQPRPLSCGDGKICGTEVCDTGLPSSCPSGQTCRSSDCGACETIGCTGDTQCTSLADQCNTGVCNLTTHACQRQPRTNGTTCTDSDPCTANDRCTGGICAGGPHCGDGVIQTGCGEECDGSSAGCSAGESCNASCACIGNSGSCTLNSDCDDGDHCTIDRCVGGSCRRYQAPPGIEGPAGDATCSNGVDDDCNGLADTGDPKCTRPASTSCGDLPIAIIDPTPTLVLPTTDRRAARLITNANDLAVKGTPRSAIAADDTNRALIRIATPTAGDVTVTINSGTSEPTAAGALSDISETVLVQVLTVATTSTSAGSMAFLVYHPPQQFRTTPEDGSLLARTVTLSATFRAAGATPPLGPCTREVTIVRPPVLLVHGLWGTPAGWLPFLRRFFPQLRLDDLPNHPVATPSASSPWFIGTADYSEVNSSKFFLGAAHIAADLDALVRAYRSSSPSTNGIITSGADVVGHSMGGLVTRALAMCEPLPGLFQDCASEPYMLSNPFRRPDNFFAGGIRRLITVGSPHLGSPFATKIRDAVASNVTCGDKCVQSSTAGTTCAARVPVSASEFFGNLLGPVGGAMDDLSVEGDGSLSGALEALASNPAYGVATHAIAGEASTTDKQPMNDALLYLNFQCSESVFPTTIDELLGSANDLIVSSRSESATGLLDSDATSILDPDVTPLIHSPAIAERIINLYGVAPASPAELESLEVWLLVRALLHGGPELFAPLPQ